MCDTDNTFIEIVRRQREFIQALNPRRRQEKIILKSNSGEKKTTFYPKSPPMSPKEQYIRRKISRTKLSLGRSKVVLDICTNGGSCHWIQAVDF